MKVFRAVFSNKAITSYLDTRINHQIFRMASAQTTQNVKPQQFDYFLVLDFEATCDNTKKIVPQEIIEFPVLKVNPSTLQVESTFHQYVQPKVHKQLTTFCTELTGIVQDMVDGQPFLEATLDSVVVQRFSPISGKITGIQSKVTKKNFSFHEWMEAELLANNSTFTFVICGDWDMKTMLPSQSKYFGIPLKPYFNNWINIKRSFAEVTGVFPKSMMAMLRDLNIPHRGRHHSGIDDCKNIAAILTGLLQRGYVFQNTGSRCN